MWALNHEILPKAMVTKWQDHHNLTTFKPYFTFFSPTAAATLSSFALPLLAHFRRTNYMFSVSMANISNALIARSCQHHF
jgi:hypothetical protein